MTADEDRPARSVFVSFVPPVADSKTVRFRGSTFQELKDRLVEAKVPGVGTTSFVEVEVPYEGYVCLLDEDVLPGTDNISVHVHLDLVRNKEPIVIPGQPAPVGGPALALLQQPDEGTLPRRWAKQVHKINRMERRLRQRDSKLQEKVQRMYGRLQTHGTWHSPPGSPLQHSEGHAIGVPEIPPQPPHHHDHHSHGRHGHHHRGRGRCFSPPMQQPTCFPPPPPPLGIPVVQGTPFVSDPSGAGAVAEPVEPQKGGRSDGLSTGIKGLKIRE